MNGILFKPWKILYIAEHPDIAIQTRRVIKLKGYSQAIWDKCVPHNGKSAELLGEPYLKVPYDKTTDNMGTRITARYQVGETVYIKEAWRTRSCYDNTPPSDISEYAPIEFATLPNLVQHPLNGRWRSPLHLKEVHAQYFPTITDVRAERLQEITRDDVVAEGLARDEFSYANKFMNLWNSINKDYPWEMNPWVWRYEFRRVDYASKI